MRRRNESHSIVCILVMIESFQSYSSAGDLSTWKYSFFIKNLLVYFVSIFHIITYSLYWKYALVLNLTQTKPFGELEESCPMVNRVCSLWFGFHYVAQFPEEFTILCLKTVGANRHFKNTNYNTPIVIFAHREGGGSLYK